MGLSCNGQQFSYEIPQANKKPSARLGYFFVSCGLVKSQRPPKHYSVLPMLLVTLLNLTVGPIAEEIATIQKSIWFRPGSFIPIG